MQELAGRTMVEAASLVEATPAATHVLATVLHIQCIQPGA